MRSTGRSCACKMTPARGTGADRRLPRPWRRCPRSIIPRRERRSWSTRCYWYQVVPGTCRRSIRVVSRFRTRPLLGPPAPGKPPPRFPTLPRGPRPPAGRRLLLGRRRPPPARRRPPAGVANPRMAQVTTGKITNCEPPPVVPHEQLAPARLRRVVEEGVVEPLGHRVLPTPSRSDPNLTVLPRVFAAVTTMNVHSKGFSNVHTRKSSQIPSIGESLQSARLQNIPGDGQGQ